jgi:hypothetical protein
MANFSQTLTKLVEFTKEKKNSKNFPIFWMKKATNVFARKKISVHDLPQRRAQKDPKTSKTIILNLDKG